MKIELVYWRDAYFDTDPRDTEPKDYINRTVGWVKDEGRFLRIESERTPDGPRAVTHVPHENIVRRVELEQ